MRDVVCLVAVTKSATAICEVVMGQLYRELRLKSIFAESIRNSHDATIIEQPMQLTLFAVFNLPSGEELKSSRHVHLPQELLCRRFHRRQIKQV